jgi:hypothetical protein
VLRKHANAKVELGDVVDVDCQSASDRDPRIASSDNVTESDSSPRRTGRDLSR